MENPSTQKLHVTSLSLLKSVNFPSHAQKVPNLGTRIMEEDKAGNRIFNVATFTVDLPFILYLTGKAYTK